MAIRRPAARASASCPKGRSSNRACFTNWSIPPRIRRSPDWVSRRRATSPRFFVTPRRTTQDIPIPSPAPCGRSTPPASRSRAGSCATSSRSGSTRTPARRRTRAEAICAARRSTASSIGSAARAAFFSTIASPSRSAPIGSISPAGIPNFEFPFAYQTTTDSVTGRTDGLLRRCSRERNLPQDHRGQFRQRILGQGWRAGAYRHRRAAICTDAKDVRIYLLPAGRMETAFRFPGQAFARSRAIRWSEIPRLRALLAALDAWAAEGVEPPDQHGSARRRWDVGPALLGRTSGFRRFREVPYLGRMHEGDLMDFGPQASEGILTVLPPHRLGSPYPALVPKTDADGNTLAGVRLPDIAAPVATYTGWNLRKNPPDEGCDASGMVIPFARTKAQRMASGDPRLSLEERYPGHAVVRSRGDRKRARSRASPAASRGGCGAIHQGGRGQRRRPMTSAGALDGWRRRLRDDGKIIRRPARVREERCPNRQRPARPRAPDLFMRLGQAPEKSVLDPIETASRDEITPCKRVEWRPRCAVPTTTSRRSSAKFDAQGVNPADFRTLADLARFPFTIQGGSQRSTTHSVFWPCREISSRGFTPRRARPASPRWSAIRKTISTCGATSSRGRSAPRAGAGA